jgi:hypothetical protein
LTWYASPEHILLTPFAGLMALPFALFVRVKATVLQSQQHKPQHAVNMQSLQASMLCGGQTLYALCRD